jgi:hypothetical protein
MELKNAFIRVALTRVWEWLEATHPEKKKSSTYLQTANFDFDTCGQHTRATLNGLGLRLLHVLQCTMENDAIYGK